MPAMHLGTGLSWRTCSRASAYRTASDAIIATRMAVTSPESREGGKLCRERDQRAEQHPHGKPTNRHVPRRSGT